MRQAVRFGEIDLSGLVGVLEVGFATSHMSNFLNPPRGISPEAVDRPLDMLRVDILDLADPGVAAAAVAAPECASENNAPFVM